jgi:hypothetical protein
VAKSPKTPPAIAISDLLRLPRQESDAAIAELHRAGRLGTTLSLANNEACWLLGWFVAAWDSMRHSGLVTAEDVDHYEIIKSILAKWQAGTEKEQAPVAGPRDGEAYEPRRGDTLAAWVNRNRPAHAPTVTGEPTWRNDEEAFAWHANSWTITVTPDCQCTRQADGLPREVVGLQVCWQESEGACYVLRPNGWREVCGFDWHPVATAGEAAESMRRAAAEGRGRRSRARRR